MLAATLRPTVAVVSVVDPNGVLPPQDNLCLMTGLWPPGAKS